MGELGSGVDWTERAGTSEHAVAEAVSVNTTRSGLGTVVRTAVTRTELCPRTTLTSQTLWMKSQASLLGHGVGDDVRGPGTSSPTGEPGRDTTDRARIVGRVVASCNTKALLADDRRAVEVRIGVI